MLCFGSDFERQCVAGCLRSFILPSLSSSPLLSVHAPDFCLIMIVALLSVCRGTQLCSFSSRYILQVLSGEGLRRPQQQQSGPGAPFVVLRALIFGFLAHRHETRSSLRHPESFAAHLRYFPSLRPSSPRDTSTFAISPPHTALGEPLCMFLWLLFVKPSSAPSM